MSFAIPFQLIEIEPESYHLIVKAKLNGNLVMFIVDSGASRSVLDISYDTGIRVDGIEGNSAIGFMADNVDIDIAQVPEIVIGKYTFNNLLMAVTDLSALRTVYTKLTGIDVAGLLGCDFLVDHVSSINFRNRKIFLKQGILGIENEIYKG